MQVTRMNNQIKQLNEQVTQLKQEKLDHEEKTRKEVQSHIERNDQLQRFHKFEKKQKE